MTGLAKRLARLETIQQRVSQEVRSLQVVFWDGKAAPEPCMTISWKPSGPTSRVYHPPYAPPHRGDPSARLIRRDPPEPPSGTFTDTV